MIKKITKNDIILIIVIALLGTIVSIFFAFQKTSGTDVHISVQGKLHGTYTLIEDKRIEISKNHYSNEIIIKGGKVSMVKSNCLGKDCVNQGEKSKAGETIICLPNQILVEVIGGEKEFDSVAK